MPFCDKCGNEVNEGDKFCAACGTRVRPKLAKSTADLGMHKARTAETRVSAADGDKTPNWFRRHLNWTAAIAIVVLFLLAALGNLQDPVEGALRVNSITSFVIDISRGDVGQLDMVLSSIGFVALFFTHNWVLRQKERSLLTLLLTLIPFGLFAPLFLADESRRPVDMEDFVGNAKVCDSAEPVLAIAKKMRPDDIDVNEELKHPNCVDVLIFDPLEFYVERPEIRPHFLLLVWYYAFIAPFVYESGAILGRARRDKVDCLAEMTGVWSIPANEIGSLIQDLASKRLNEFVKNEAREPKSFEELIRYTVWEAALKRHDYKIDYQRRRIDVPTALKYLRTLVLEGIGFGSRFAELTERMYRQHYECIDMKSWNEAKQRGADIPDQPKIVTLEAVEEDILVHITAVVQDSYPKLLEPLGLLPYTYEFRTKDLRDEAGIFRSDLPAGEFSKEWSNALPYTFYDRFNMFHCLLGK